MDYSRNFDRDDEKQAYFNDFKIQLLTVTVYNLQ